MSESEGAQYLSEIQVLLSEHRVQMSKEIWALALAPDTLEGRTQYTYRLPGGGISTIQASPHSLGLMVFAMKSLRQMRTTGMRCATVLEIQPRDKPVCYVLTQLSPIYGVELEHYLIFDNPKYLALTQQHLCRVSMQLAENVKLHTAFDKWPATSTQKQNNLFIVTQYSIPEEYCRVLEDQFEHLPKAHGYVIWGDTKDTRRPVTFQHVAKTEVVTQTYRF